MACSQSMISCCKAIDSKGLDFKRLEWRELGKQTLNDDCLVLTIAFFKILQTTYQSLSYCVTRAKQLFVLRAVCIHWYKLYVI